MHTQEPGIQNKHLWSRWGLPIEGTTEYPRIHTIGMASIQVAVDGEGKKPILAVRTTLRTEKPGLAAPGGKIASKAIAAGKKTPPLNDPSWTRAYLGAASGYDLMPAYDDKPVCVRLNEPFILPPGASTSAWLITNTNAEILIDGQIVMHIPLKPVYKTLYGNPSNGVVCVFARSGFFSSDEPDYTRILEDPSTVAHPVKIKNNATTPVPVEELCVYGEQLSIFSRNDRLFSETLVFTFSESGVRMGIASPGRTPDGAELLVRPKVSNEEKVFERSVELFKAITRM